jgi:hypothetical protein
MTSLAVATDGLPIYDVAGQQLFQVGSVVTDAAGVVADINPANGIPRDANGADIPQPPQLTRVNDLMANAVARATNAALATTTTTTAPPAVVTVTPMPVTFARAPGRVDRNIIDYKTKGGEALYKRATMSLYEDGEPKFSLKDEDMLSFLDLVSMRAKNFGWDVFSITTTAPGSTPSITKNLLTEYGETSLEQVRAKDEAMAVINDRTTQEDDQLFTCLMSFLTKAARNSVDLRRDDFMVGTEHSGILLFKVILAKSQVDTKATIALLVGKLTTGMTNIMVSHGNNITEFNAEVMETLRKLQSRGKGGSTEIDLLPQLFVAYASCGSSDTPFHRYIEHLENRHNDGDITLSTKSLMDKAETKYEELKDKVKFTNHDNSMGNKEGEG